jgi:predicted enzyme related to lactoylglutathione lyase
MNTIAYFEIQSDELDAAARFYKAVFGWEFVKDQTMPVRPS